MGWIKNLLIRTKLLLGFGVMNALMVGLAVMAYFSLAEIQRINREEVDTSIEAVATLLQVRADQNRIRGSMLGHVAFTDTASRAAFRQDVAQRAEQVTRGVESVKSSLTSKGLQGELAMVAAMEQEIAAYRDGRTEEFDLVTAGRTADALALAAGVQTERFERIRAMQIALGDSLQSKATVQIANATQIYHQTVWWLVLVAVAAVFFSLVMVWVMTYTISDLRQGVSVLASSSTEILATVSQVAANASETATAVSETSATAEEVKQTAHLSNQKAKAVHESAEKATVVSEAGRKAVGETLEVMNRIREQMESVADSVVRLSEQGQAIGEIIATVSDLAEQSNLLAVNAALEATRAGEYGRGFAVVAQEVKSLAEQSRQATTQVRTILMEVQKATSAAVMATEQGTKAVAAGVKQATGAGESIQALAASVGEAAKAAIQITASSHQQLVGMDQIASAIANIQQATTQNVAGTAQLETSARSLQELGVRLRAMVER